MNARTADVMAERSALLGVALCLVACRTTVKPVVDGGPSARPGQTSSGTAPSVPVRACLPVQVVDETGKPLARAQVQTLATAWIGPSGSFYYEGGMRHEFKSGTRVTGADGGACVDAAWDQAERERAKLNSPAQRSGSFIPYGGFGPTHVGKVSAIGIVATYGTWPSGFAQSPFGAGALSTTVVRLGPRRTREVRIESACDPTTLRVLARYGTQLIRGQQTRPKEPVFRLEGLGPFKYDLRIDTCDFAPKQSVLDVEKSETLSIDLRDPNAPEGPKGAPVQISLSDGSACLVSNRGEVGCFSELDYRSDLDPPLLVPRWKPAVDLESAVKVVTSASFTCALTRAGDVLCWGFSEKGALGELPSSEIPARIPLARRTIDIERGSSHLCARLEGGAVACWGWNAHGQLGNGSRVERVPSPVEIGPWRGARSLGLAGRHTCAVSNDGGVSCAGWNFHGTIGSGKTADNSYFPDPTRVPNVSEAALVRAGNWASYAVTSAGGVLGWGLLPGETVPMSPQRLPLHDVVELAASDYHACVRKKDGSVSCFGSTQYGAVPGAESATVPPARARRVLDLPSSTALAASNSLTCSFSADRKIFCWGTGQKTSQYWKRRPYAGAPTRIALPVDR